MKRFHVITVEHRGHGTSQWASDGRYRVVDYADDLIAVLETAQLGPVSISGNSLGGLIALNVAARRPDLVRAIALEDAPLLITDQPHWKAHWLYPMFTAIFDLLTQWRARGEGMDALARRVSALPLYRPRLEQPVADRKVAHDKMVQSICGGDALDKAEQARLASGWRRYLQGERPTLGECLPHVVIQSMAGVIATVDPRAPAHAVDVRLNEGFDHLAALRSVRCPVLLWEADRVLGGIVPPEQIAAIRAALQHIAHRHFIVEGAGHHIHCDAPDRFVDHSTEFFLPGR
jgi:pimeloyl-ACP methyl ester carboxylesterase